MKSCERVSFPEEVLAVVLARGGDFGAEGDCLGAGDAPRDGEAFGVLLPRR
jgi:hypothetical protein